MWAIKKRTIRLDAIVGAIASVLLLAAPNWLYAAPGVVNFDVNFFGNGSNAGVGGPGTYSGTAAGPTGAGTYWNAADGGYTGTGSSPITSGGSVFLADGTTPTNIAFSVTNTYGYYGGTDNALLDDYATQFSNQVGSFSLTNVPAGTYDVYVYAVNGSFASSTTKITLSSGVAHNGINIADNNYTDGSLHEGDNYVLFTGVTPNGGGTISGTYTGTFSVGQANYSGEGDFSGIQLVAVPEPSTLVLAGLAGLGFLGLPQRRRRRRSGRRWGADHREFQARGPRRPFIGDRRDQPPSDRYLVSRPGSTLCFEAAVAAIVKR